MNNKEPANTAKLILMFFYASWAPQSLALLPLLAEIENEKKSTMLVYDLDIDKEKSLSNKYSVESAPTAILIKNDAVVGRLIGVSNRLDLLSFIKSTTKNIKEVN